MQVNLSFLRMSVLLETSLGDLVVDLYVEHSPTASFNFIKLCKIKYYNNCLFDKIERDFLVYCGDATTIGKRNTSIFGLKPKNEENSNVKQEHMHTAQDFYAEDKTSSPPGKSASASIKNEDLSESSSSANDLNQQGNFENSKRSNDVGLSNTGTSHDTRYSQTDEDGRPLDYDVSNQATTGLLRSVPNRQGDKSCENPDLSKPRAPELLPAPTGSNSRLFFGEISPLLTHSKLGQLGMVAASHTKENTNMYASRFYVTSSGREGSLSHLDSAYTLFGEIAEGLEVLQRINTAYVDDDGKPLQHIRILSTLVVEDPFEDPPWLARLIPEQSPEREIDSEFKQFDDANDELLMLESIAEKEAKSRKIALEILGDIPESNFAPPENVLFVCKLNPATESKDLETLFSRFGKIVSCEVIYDFKSGSSLQYAFIEFENKSACEDAYFKMQDVLVDDRRIHVDFSQSLSKVWHTYKLKEKGKGNPVFDENERHLINYGQPQNKPHAQTILKSGPLPTAGSSGREYSQSQKVADKFDGIGGHARSNGSRKSEANGKKRDSDRRLEENEHELWRSTGRRNYHQHSSTQSSSRREAYHDHSRRHRTKGYAYQHEKDAIRGKKDPDGGVYRGSTTGARGSRIDANYYHSYEHCRSHFKANYRIEKASNNEGRVVRGERDEDSHESFRKHERPRRGSGEVFGLSQTGPSFLKRTGRSDKVDYINEVRHEGRDRHSRGSYCRSREERYPSSDTNGSGNEPVSNDTRNSGYKKRRLSPFPAYKEGHKRYDRYDRSDKPDKSRSRAHEESNLRCKVRESDARYTTDSKPKKARRSHDSQ